jgi:hypothetical protein
MDETQMAAKRNKNLDFTWISKKGKHVIMSLWLMLITSQGWESSHKAGFENCHVLKR